uniref:(California timema) hypothetical protein n=1 Tax=Timema californicum TaxID=61474 RepID=A0A7R9P6J2_TIMCA|nr:unnamed protein product [Timema californicum]
MQLQEVWKTENNMMRMLPERTEGAMWWVLPAITAGDRERSFFVSIMSDEIHEMSATEWSPLFNRVKWSNIPSRRLGTGPAMLLFTVYFNQWAD